MWVILIGIHVNWIVFFLNKLLFLTLPINIHVNWAHAQRYSAVVLMAGALPQGGDQEYSKEVGEVRQQWRDSYSGQGACLVIGWGFIPGIPDDSPKYHQE